ncbi:peptide chain release factor N(5)-glutamine methyltransferase [Caldilinea sp.]|uniref:peptide chain release factor N(5)-glutamine methyltransferase n=1 Tax=Caldilinea sp. TaxID=2293560 RepID=UPI001B0A16FE|nr:peptide chain release factor N(5)-glutamine methyltransferase [Caldilinea sp.]MBO9391425.1 peptide chain release factor N(5)-glutamine methyltransferase [Caldilinea sp.]
MAILPLEVRPKKGERRNFRAQWRVATGPNGDQPVGISSGASHEDARSSTSTMAEDAQIWQEVIWRLSNDVTVGQAINAATQRLEEANISTARLDAQVILAHVLGVDRSWLFAHHEQTLSPQQAEVYTELVVRRVMHEPVAYLTHYKEFYGIDLYVDRRVLIPRPETEMLVDQVLTEATIRAPQQVLVADVGTGSGAIAVAIAMNTENAHIYALDVSENALAVARRNVETYALGERIHLLQSDLLAALPKRVDIVVANLPYVTDDDYRALEPDVRDYEPAQALLGGPQGLDVIARLLPQLPLHCNSSALVVLEIGYNQGPAMLEMVETLLPQATQIELHRDYQGRDRVISFQL